LTLTHLAPHTTYRSRASRRGPICHSEDLPRPGSSPRKIKITTRIVRIKSTASHRGKTHQVDIHGDFYQTPTPRHPPRIVVNVPLTRLEQTRCHGHEQNSRELRQKSLRRHSMTVWTSLWRTVPKASLVACSWTGDNTYSEDDALITSETVEQGAVLRGECSLRRGTEQGVHSAEERTAIVQCVLKLLAHVIHP
jgi:hypothetical protein